MPKGKDIEERTQRLLLPIVQKQGISVYDVEYVKEAGDWYLRAYIDKPGGVTIQDCETVSRALSDRLDEEDYIEEAYILEVSSPGLGRALKKDKHLQASLGEKVEVRLYRPQEKQKEFSGILKAFDEESVTLQLYEEDGQQDAQACAERKFARADIALIKLALDF